ncbi:hypothetical protein [Salimicrobium flavidum]|nr:hypothetical protein [Salimicrobium flavidum]
MIKEVIFQLEGILLVREASVVLFLSDQEERFKELLNQFPKEYYLKRFII